MKLSRLVSVLCPAIAIALSSARSATAQDREDGTNANLLLSIPFDRITLGDNKTFTIEPIVPRPLPPLEAKPQDSKEKETKADDGGDEENADARKPGEQELKFTMLSPPGGDYRVKRKDIKGIVYFEDMLLAKGDELLQRKEFGPAFEHFLYCKTFNPKWGGVEDRVDKLLYEEGTDAIAHDRGEQGLLLLRDLQERKPNFPGLAGKLVEGYALQVGKAFAAGSYSRARRFLHDMETIAPDDPRTKEARERFVLRAKQLVDAAPREMGTERTEALAEALRVWPTLEGGDKLFEEAFRSSPSLDVAVLDLSHSVAKNVRCPAPWVRSPADERVTRLLFYPIMAKDDQESARGERADQIAASVETAGLGVRTTIKIKKGFSWSDGSRPVGAIDAVRTLSDRADPRSPGFNARWADLVKRIEAIDESTLEIRLARPPLRAEWWYLGPVGPAHAAWDGWVSTENNNHQPVGDGLFRWEGTTKTHATYRFAPASEGSGAKTPLQAKIHRLRERRIPNAEEALGALARGEVSLIEHAPLDRVPNLSQTKGLKVGRYNHPLMHLIAIDARNPALRGRSLRRGLSYAIDRKAILEETILKRGSDANNLVADGPFPAESYANAKNVRPLEYQPILALMLLAAAKAEAEENLTSKLKFEYPAVPEAQMAAPRIVSAFKQAGLTVTPIERPLAELEEELRDGRRFDLVYRIVPVTEPGFQAGPLICPGYDSAPAADGLGAIASPRILELLLHLEHAPDLPSARTILNLIDRESRDELPVIPLWQTEEYYTWSERLNGPAPTADHIYEGIEKWEIAPWFAKDPW